MEITTDLASSSAEVLEADRFLEFPFFRGRVALAAALKACGIVPGDRVAIQAFTCVAVPEALIAVGAIPVYVDIDPDTLAMSPERLREASHDGSRAIVLQHSFGVPADAQAILQIANERAIPLIEDCCHTLRSSIADRRVGSFGVVAFYSFEWGKPIIAGTGGSLVVNDSAMRPKLDTLYKSYREPSALRQRRISLQRWAHSVLYRPGMYWWLRALYRAASRIGIAEGSYNPIEAGNPPSDFFLRMGARQRKALRVALREVDDDTEIRLRVARSYRDALDLPGVRHLPLRPGSNPVLARYPLLVHDKFALLRRAEERRIEIAGWYETAVHPLGRDDAQKVGYTWGSCPNAQWIAERIVTLPINRRVDAKYIAEVRALLASEHERAS